MTPKSEPGVSDGDAVCETPPQDDTRSSESEDTTNLPSKHVLTLEEKVKVIHRSQVEGVSYRRLSDEFRCGRTQIKNIVKSNSQKVQGWLQSQSQVSEPATSAR